MTKLEVMQENKRMYAEFSAKIPSMNGLEKVVAENLTLEWIQGNKWLGGISDSKYQRISDKLVAQGYDEMDILNEFDRQVMSF